MDDAFVASRIKGLEVYPIELPHHLREITSSRQFLSSIYGGNTQRTFPNINDEMLKKHGFKTQDFMYPSLLYNPHAPVVPGHPGLFFGIGVAEDGDYPDRMRVITRLRSSQWQYVGQYEMRASKSLSRKEWLKQDDAVKNAWINKIAEKWGTHVRPRIVLRKRLAREPTKDEFEAALESDEDFTNVTHEEIRKAFDSGEEMIAVYTMNCVDYDTKFQQTIIDKAPEWVKPPPKGKRKRSTAGKGNAKNKGRPVKQSRKGKEKLTLTKLGKRQRVELDESDEEETDDISAYRSKGTRSRPIIVE
ncbi:hypothetical protein C8J56DRAFT_799872 [Mycena floridula]|nr:hypothetical protein C8J56DRAFT_799872 [Mycena floridula]